jgi:hypothetical protein
MMRNDLTIRTKRWRKILRHAPRRWGWRSTVRCGERSVPVGQLLRSLRISPRGGAGSGVMHTFLLRLFRRLLWWSSGAFGSRGRLEGGQYLAGRRAPPYS